MTERMAEGTLRDPWKERDQLPRISRTEQILACVAVLVSSLGLSFFANEQISFFFLLPLLFFTVSAMRAPGSVTLVLLTALAASVLVGSLSGATALLAVVVGVGSLSWLFSVTARPYAAALPLLAALGIYLFSRDLIMSALSLSFLPAAALLAIATVTGQRRTTAICFAIGGFLLSIAAGLGAFFWNACGSLEPSAIAQYLENTRAWLLEGTLSVRDTFISTMRESLVAEGIAAEQIEETVTRFGEFLSPALLEEVIALLFSILPSLIVIACSIAAFEAQLYLNLSFFRTGWREVLTLHSSMFSMSVVSSVIYIVGFMLTMFIDTSSLFGAAVQNVTLMLIPGFCVMGWGAVLGALRTSRGGQRFFLILLLVFSVCCAGVSIVYFLALWGAYAAIMTALRMSMAEKLREMGGRDGDEDGDGDDPDGGNG